MKGEKEITFVTFSSQKHWDLSSKYLKQICQSLKLSRPPPNITSELLFTKLESQLRTAINKSKHGIGKPLLQTTLSEQQWVSAKSLHSVSKDNKLLFNE